MEVVPTINRMMYAVNIVILRLHQLHEIMLQAATLLLAGCAGTVQHTLGATLRRQEHHG